MLSNIKAMINDQKALLEAAEVITEDVIGNLDDMIVLGEGVSDDLTDQTGDEDPSVEPVNEPSGGEPQPEPEPSSDEGEEDLLGSSIDGNDDLLSDDIGGGEELPTPIGAQTGEPVQLDSSDLLNMEIDLSTNTPTDILPIPPAGAADAVVGDDDIMTQKIDSGFGGDSNPSEPATPITPAPPAEDENALGGDIADDNTPPPAEPSTEETEDLGGETPADIPSDPGTSSGEQFSEAITIDGGEEPPAEEGAAPDEGMGDGDGENSITSAVRDKVSEAEGTGEEEFPEEPPAEEGAAEGDNFGGSESKESILKKLNNLTKSLEDAKNAVIQKL